MPVSLIYRTAGPWGAGKGSNLTPAEVDSNFAQVTDAITALEESAPTPVGIAEFEVDAATGTFTVTLSDSSTFGPFPLPKTIMQWQGEYTAGADYAINNLFTVEGDGVYIVLQAHEAASDFDPDAINSDGPLYGKVFGMPESTFIPVETSELDDGIEDLAATHLGTYRRFVGTGVMLYQVLADDLYDPPLPLGAIVTIRHAGDPLATLGWLEGHGVTINAPDTLQLRKSGSQSTIVRVGSNLWEASGDLALEPVSA